MVGNGTNKTLGIYDDAPIFGGHEQMSCCGIEGLAQESDLEIVVFYYKENEKLHSKLEDIHRRFPRIRLVPIDAQSRKLQGVRSRFAGKTTSDLARRFSEEKVDGALVLQGDIELSSLGVLAGRKLGIPTVSYIPVPHTLHTMGAKLGKWRDPLNGWLFKRPSSFITISEGMKELLRERGASQRIEVVFNGFDPSKTQKRDREASRNELELATDRRWIGMVGRIEFKQKRQDFLLKCFAERLEDFPNVNLVFVGSGPDSDVLEAEAKRLGLEDRVTFIPWTDSLSSVYSAIDVLALPSQFEGVPLVMLEAMSVGAPIVGSARDGMKEFLPDKWLFAPGSIDECAQRLRAVLDDPGEKEIEANRQRATTELNMTTFHQRFTSVVRELTGT